MNNYTIQSDKVIKSRVFIIKKSELEFRLDPHFYLNEYKELCNKIKSKYCKKLGEIVKFSNEIWNQKDFFNTTFPYIEISEIDTKSGEIKNISLMQKSNAPSRAKMIVRENDIIVSTTRPNRGAISLIKKENDLSIASTGFSVIRNININEIEREFLYTVLRQKVILKQFEQRSSGGNYPAITQEELSNVLIPIPDEYTQKKIRSVYKNALDKKKQNEIEADKLLMSIDKYLFNELGINLPALQDNKLENRIFKKSISHFSGSRLDPYYYQLYFEKILECVVNGKYPVKTIGNISLRVDTGKTPAKSLYADEENEEIIKIIKAGSYTLDYIDLSKCDYTLPNFDGVEVFQGDIFILGAAHQAEYIGKKVYYLTDEVKEKVYFVGELNRISVNPNEYNSLLLFSILKSKLYSFLLNREKRGQTSHLYPNDVKKIIVPLPPLKKQREIADYISNKRLQVYRLTEKTKEILKTANVAIEKLLLS